MKMNLDHSFNIDYHGRNLNVICESKWEEDKHYGSDADGNRGISCWILEDVYNIQITDDEDDTISLNDDIYNNIHVYVMDHNEGLYDY